MLTLNEILTAVDQLSPEEREQVRRHLESHEPQKVQRTPEEIAQHMALLDDITRNFWGDMPAEEVELIVNAMSED